MLAGASLLSVFVVFGLFMIAATVVWIVALVSALQTPEGAFAANGQNKMLWVLLIVFLHLLGAILYFAIGKPRPPRW